jgi:transcriptional regulator with XRE-family HTH domain
MMAVTSWASPLYPVVKGVRVTDLRSLRRQRLLSQQELATQAGVSKATIVGIESGKTRPYPATLRKLAKALGVEQSELAGYLEDR